MHPRGLQTATNARVACMVQIKVRSVARLALLEHIKAQQLPLRASTVLLARATQTPGPRLPAHAKIVQLESGLLLGNNVACAVMESIQVQLAPPHAKTAQLESHQMCWEPLQVRPAKIALLAGGGQVLDSLVTPAVLESIQMLSLLPRLRHAKFVLMRSFHLLGQQAVLAVLLASTPARFSVSIVSKGSSQL